MEQDERGRKRVLSHRGEQAGGSEYLECNGIERFVVTYVGRFPSIYRNHRPWNTQERGVLVVAVCGLAAGVQLEQRLGGRGVETEAHLLLGSLAKLGRQGDSFIGPGGW